VLRHANIQTARGCIAVFDEDVICHCQEHLQHRRQVCPEGQYRDATPEECSELSRPASRRHPKPPAGHFEGNLCSVPPGMPGMQVTVRHRLGEDYLHIATVGRAVVPSTGSRRAWPGGRSATPGT
jgi:hypothetical protein